MSVKIGHQIVGNQNNVAVEISYFQSLQVLGNQLILFDTDRIWPHYSTDDANVGTISQD